jgi:hypothetical protein
MEYSVLTVVKFVREMCAKLSMFDQLLPSIDVNELGVL